MARDRQRGAGSTDTPHDVAVDAETFEPRFLRIDRGPVATVLKFEALPSGQGSFTPRARGSGRDERWSGEARPGARSPAEARTALLGAPWLGERFRGLPLSSIREVAWPKPAHLVPVGKRSVRALELCYGSEGSCPVSMTLATAMRSKALPGQAWRFAPPPGTLAFGGEPGIGLVVRDGIYVTLLARSRSELIAAAEALTPIP